MAVRSTNVISSHGAMIQVEMGMLLIDGQPLFVHRTAFPLFGTALNLTNNVNLEMSEFKMTISVKDSEEIYRDYNASGAVGKSARTTKNPVVKIGNLDVEQAIEWLKDYEQISNLSEESFLVNSRVWNSQRIEQIPKSNFLTYGYYEVEVSNERMQVCTFHSTFFAKGDEEPEPYPDVHDSSPSSSQIAEAHN